MSRVDVRDDSVRRRMSEPGKPRRVRRSRASSLTVGVAVVGAMVAAIFAPGAVASTVQAAADKMPGYSVKQPAQSPAAAVQELAAAAPLFGVYTAGSPTDLARIDAAQTAAGTHIGIVPYFADAEHPLNVELLDAASADGAVPMLTLETNSWSTSDIAAGVYDNEIRTLADKLGQANGGDPGVVMVRLNHEMNGHWYSWSEGAHGNPPGAYAAAWQRIVDVVRETGTGSTTVLWVWSPNILRGAQLDTMIDAYPGDEYVDYIGLTGYGDTVYERTASQTFDETIGAIRSRVSTDKPLMITESGASPGKYRTDWTRSLGPWLNAHPDVHAFVWFDTDQTSGASNDWRFTDNPDVAEALRQSLAEAGAVAAPAPR